VNGEERESQTFRLAKRYPGAGVGGGVNRSCGCRRARVDDTEDIVNGGSRRLLSRVRPA
jgi:hypothetical protein